MRLLEEAGLSADLGNRVVAGFVIAHFDGNHHATDAGL
jgi:hypothetical protein